MSEIKRNVFSLPENKLLLFPERIRTWLDNRPVSPVLLEILPTERCNHRCPECQGEMLVGSKKRRQLASGGVDLDFSLLDSVWKNPPAGVVISGNTGEPFMHSQIDWLLQKLLDLKIPTIMISNGESLKDEHIELTLRACHGFRISLDAANSHSYSRCHGVKSSVWDVVVNNIKKVVNARDRIGLTQSDCLFGVGFLVNNDNIDEMVSATKMVRDIGCDYIQFRPYHNKMIEIEDKIDELEAFKSNDFRVFISQQKYGLVGLERGYSRCHAGHFSAFVDSRGKFYMCCHFIGDEKALLGNLHNQSWTQFIQGFERLEKINSFELDRCVPFCRLNAHNEFLKKVSKQGLFTTNLNPLPDEVKKHSPFL